MVADCDHLRVVFPGLVENRLHPLIGSALDHSAYLIHRIVLAGVQHEKPQAAVHLVQVAEGIGIPAVGGHIAEFRVNILEFLRRYAVHRIGIRAGKLLGIGIVNIVVSRNH